MKGFFCSDLILALDIDLQPFPTTFQSNGYQNTVYMIALFLNLLQYMFQIDVHCALIGLHTLYSLCNTIIFLKTLGLWDFEVREFVKNKTSSADT